MPTTELGVFLVFVTSYALLEDNDTVQTKRPVVAVSDILVDGESVLLTLVSPGTYHAAGGLLISGTGTLADLSTDFFLPDMPEDLIEQIKRNGLIIKDVSTNIEHAFSSGAISFDPQEFVEQRKFAG